MSFFPAYDLWNIRDVGPWLGAGGGKGEVGKRESFPFRLCQNHVVLASYYKINIKFKWKKEKIQTQLHQIRYIIRWPKKAQ